jgi:oligopeptide/dipeptide ABC transporter ATP-binding protein
LNTVRYLSDRVAVLYLGMVVEEGSADEIFAKPRHPYSIGLLSSVLLPDPKLERTARLALEGEIPSPIDLPKGCYLASRCPYADERCAEMPRITMVGKGHMVRCYKHEEMAAMEDTRADFAKFQADTEFVLSQGLE